MLIEMYTLHTKLTFIVQFKTLGLAIIKIVWNAKMLEKISGNNLHYLQVPFNTSCRCYAAQWCAVQLGTTRVLRRSVFGQLRWTKCNIEGRKRKWRRNQGTALSLQTVLCEIIRKGLLALILTNTRSFLTRAVFLALNFFLRSIFFPCYLGRKLIYKPY